MQRAIPSKIKRSADVPHARGEHQENKAQKTIDTQRRRDDNKNRIFIFERGGGTGDREETLSKTLCFFCGKRHDKKVLKVQIFIVEKFCFHCAGSWTQKLNQRDASIT